MERILRTCADNIINRMYRAPHRQIVLAGLEDQFETDKLQIPTETTIVTVLFFTIRVLTHNFFAETLEDCNTQKR